MPRAGARAPPGPKFGKASTLSYICPHVIVQEMPLGWRGTLHGNLLIGNLMALTETFFARYRDRRMVWGRDGFPPECTTFLRQAAHILFQDLQPHLRDPEEFWKTIHDVLARELGVFALSEGRSHEERCVSFLSEPYDLWRSDHGDMDHFFKTRVSLVELALRKYEEMMEARSEMDEVSGGLLSWATKGRGSTFRPQFKSVVQGAVEELNARFRQGRLPLAYHAGHVQFEDDEVTADQIERPFWEILRNRKWSNVQIDMKEAIDRRDTGRRDAALYAMKALESVIKIICDERSFTRGTESGAAQYIDNLVSTTNGRFIDTWEAEQLKALFRHLRNPHSHGPGTGKQPQLTPEQETWLIESSMAWTKSLIRRK